MAPAPSPKRMQVLRSVQSVIWSAHSAPSTSAFLTAPLAMYRSAMERA